jgi:hypothetical protein
MKLIQIKSNFNKVILNDNLTIYFSYETPIAFTSKNGLVVSENIWGTTTGKHLNMINDNKSIRINRTNFETLLNETLTNIGIK